MRDLADSLGVDLREVYAAGVTGPAGMPTEADMRGPRGAERPDCRPAGAQDYPRDSAAYRPWNRCFTKGGGLA